MRALSRIALALVALLLAAGCATTGPAASNRAGGSADEVRNVILLIADGTGIGLWTAAAYARDLRVAEMPVVGLLDTRSALHKVTDSAAGASAYATGERVTNRTISVGPAAACPLPRAADTTMVWPTGCEPLERWFDVARAKGKGTGLVTTAAVVDATPAAFVASSPSRYAYEAIAEQVASASLDVLLGGGRNYFDPATRDDRRDLLGDMCGRSVCLTTAGELAAYRADERPLVGLFSAADMDDLERRPVALPVMVEAALARLEREPEGFVAVFETEATDNATHGNAPLERATADLLEFDQAVGVALDFARLHPGTLVIATSDHETGGFSLVEAGDDFRLEYTTQGHTAALVPLFAEGPQADRFGGFRDNREVGRILLEIARVW